MRQRLILSLILISIVRFTVAQEFDTIIKNGHVVDPANNVNAARDVAIANGKIALIAKDISSDRGKNVIDASGLIVCPGFIDIHTHVFVGSNPGVFADGVYSLSPDDFTFKSGVTTVVDAGTSGAQSFHKFKEQVIDQSRTRILAWLNIASPGMIGNPGQEDVASMDVNAAVDVAKTFSQHIVGIKIGHYEKSDWVPFERALQAASQAVVPLFVECHLPKYSLQDQLAKMRAGDIITHSFEKVDERTPITDEQGNVRDYVLAAQKRGVLFDLGHGGAGFWFSEAIPAMKQGLTPFTFGTDLHRFSMNAGMKDMTNVMSKFIALGMSRDDVIRRATANAAKAIHRSDLGNLSVGSVADVVIIREVEGDYGFVDAGGNRIMGDRKLIAEATIREGKVVWDLNGLTAKPFVKSR
ncbi:amidohydrolase/deacetylase family metallohydrolase [Chryseolinea sp. T2]|uniref:amidohydrolase/deacetylase family metallohydrolase n=1 Tax=Chryseolinea sp. T2 TaxID=3129255 RepID=UPI003077DA7F